MKNGSRIFKISNEQHSIHNQLFMGSQLYFKLKRMKLLHTPLLLLLLVIASCSSDDEGTDPTIPETTTYQVSISASPSNGGTVSPESGKHEKGNEVDITATPADGWEFKNWNGDYEGISPSATITIDEAKNITANFSKVEEITYALTVTIDGEGMVVDEQGDQVPDGEYGSGTVLQLTAEAKDNWEFDEWQGDITGTENPVEITIDEVKGVTAVFEKSKALFYLAENGVTVKAPNAAVGETGIVNGIIYTKRSVDQITTGNAETTCTSGITTMLDMFKDADTFNGDISHWDVSNVTSMFRMFKNAKLFNGDISNWDVSNVIDMYSIFYNANNFNGDISNWDVSSVTSTSSMFFDASNFNGDISSWDVSSVTTMRFMFQGATLFNGDIGNWDVSSVTRTSSMFFDASNFNGDISNWDVTNVTNMKSMFANAENFNGGINSWDVHNVTDMQTMFSGASSFNNDIANWDVSSVTEMDYMFNNATIFNQDLSSWCVTNIDTKPNYFANGSALSGGNEPDWGNCP